MNQTFESLNGIKTSNLKLKAYQNKAMTKIIVEVLILENIAIILVFPNFDNLIYSS